MKTRGLTEEESEIVSAAGLKPEEWECALEDFAYLHIIRKNCKNRAIIDKEKECLSDLYKCDDNFEPEEPDVKCTCCGCKIDDGDYMYCISGEILCEDCLNDQYRRIV